MLVFATPIMLRMGDGLIRKTWPGIEDKKARQMSAAAVEKWSKGLMQKFDAQRYNNIVAQMRKIF